MSLIAIQQLGQAQLPTERTAGCRVDTREVVKIFFVPWQPTSKLDFQRKGPQIESLPRKKYLTEKFSSSSMKPYPPLVAASLPPFLQRSTWLKMFIKFRGENATSISWETNSYKQGTCIANRNNAWRKSLKIAFHFIWFLLFDPPQKWVPNLMTPAQMLNVWCIYLHLGSFGGKRRKIYHTLSIWADEVNLYYWQQWGAVWWDSKFSLWSSCSVSHAGRLGHQQQ